MLLDFEQLGLSFNHLEKRPFARTTALSGLRACISLNRRLTYQIWPRRGAFATTECVPAQFCPFPAAKGAEARTALSNCVTANMARSSSMPGDISAMAFSR